MRKVLADVGGDGGTGAVEVMAASQFIGQGFPDVEGGDTVSELRLFIGASVTPLGALPPSPWDLTPRGQS